MSDHDPWKDFVDILGALMLVAALVGGFLILGNFRHDAVAWYLAWRR